MTDAQEAQSSGADAPATPTGEQQGAAGGWWETAPKGTNIAVGLVKIDREASSAEWRELPEARVRELRERYTAGVESAARSAGAAYPLHWQGDGVMLVVHGDVRSAPERAYRLARDLWDRARFELGMTVRLAVHVAEIPWNPDTGKLADPALDQCGHLEGAVPPGSIAVSEDVYLALSVAERRQLASLGATKRDGIPAYVFPADMARRRDPNLFDDGRDQSLWEAFRKYVGTAEISQLRYVGFRLSKSGPPSLDVTAVFIPPSIQVRTSNAASEGDLQDLARTIAEPTGVAQDIAVPWSRAPVLVRSDSHPFLDVLRSERHLVILGDPGSGKTTLLRWLAVMSGRGAFASGCELGISERLLPLPVSVGRLAELVPSGHSATSVLDALARYFHDRSVGTTRELTSFLDARLRAGQALVLLDGLDEVTTEDRLRIRDWLEAFAGQYERCRFLITSRVIGYPGFLLPQGKEITLRAFDDDQVQRYLETFSRAYLAWETGIDDPSFANRASQDLIAAIRKSTRLSSLARNPFLLSALALVHRAEGRLPRYRVQLYEIFSRALCEMWGRVRRIVVASAEGPHVSYEDEAIPILGELALAMHERWPAGVAPTPFVLDQVARAVVDRAGVAAADAMKIAKELLHRAGEEVQVLIERGQGFWGFLHLTFQEFFVAAGLHAREAFDSTLLDGRFLEPRWEEIARLGVGYMALIQKRPEAARRFLESVLTYEVAGERSYLTSLLHKEVAIAALLVEEAGEGVPAKLRERIAEKLLAWVRGVDREISKPILDELAGTELAMVLARSVVSRLSVEDPAERRFASHVLRCIGSPGIAPLLVEALERMLERGRTRDLTEILSLLVNLRGGFDYVLSLTRHEDPLVRSDAAIVLPENLSEVATAQLEEMCRDPDPMVRHMAVVTRATSPPWDHDQIQRLIKHDSAWMRKCGIVPIVLAQMRGTHLVHMLDDLIDDPDAEVLENAIVSMLFLGRRDIVPRLLPKLRDPDPRVRVAVLHGMGGRAAIPDLPSFLNDESGEVRAAAVDALERADGLSAENHVLQAARDLDAHVRETAMRVLGRARSSKGVSAILSGLKDTEPSVRAAAARALGALGDPKVVPHLVAVVEDAGEVEDVKIAGRSALWKIAANHPASPRRTTGAA